MNFSELHERLRAELLRRIEKGTLTRALLARRSGLAQPHISRFLSGKTNLSDAARDAILAAVNLSVEALLDPQPPATPQRSAATEFRFLLANELADADFLNSRPTFPIPREVYDPLPSVGRHLARERFVALQIDAAHAAPMQPIFEPEDTVFVDRHSTAFGSPGRAGEAPLAIYALQLTRGATLFRHVVPEPAREPLRGRLLLQPANSSFPAQSVAAPRADSSENPILGRVIGVQRFQRFQRL